MAISGAGAASDTRHRLDIGRDRAAIDAHPQRVGAGALQHDQHDMPAPVRRDRHRRSRFRIAGEGEIAAEPVLVDAIARHVEGIRMERPVERRPVYG